MVGPLLSVLFLGMVPVFGIGERTQVMPSALFIAPPAAQVLGDLPVLSIPGRLSASGVIISDLHSGQMLFQRSAGIERPMASLTKLMTALLIVEKHSLDEWVPISLAAAQTPGSSAHLPPGDEVKLGDLLSAMLIGSANDAAVALARYDSGTVEDFVAKMNTRAKELGLRSTTYVNPMGLDERTQVSTPQDIAWLATYVLRHHAIAQRMETRGAQFETKKGIKLSVTHTHALLHTQGSPVVGGKTGTTDGAGECLLSVVEHEGRRYLVVLLSSSDRYGDMRKILKVLAP